MKSFYFSGRVTTAMKNKAEFIKKRLSFLYHFSDGYAFGIFPSFISATMLQMFTQAIYTKVALFLFTGQ